MKIKSPPGDKTRPTGAKTRAAIFNLLQQHIQEAVFIDIFCGTGAIGFEALSRGAKACTFIDSNKNAQKSLETNKKNALKRFSNQNLSPPIINIYKDSLQKIIKSSQKSSLTHPKSANIIWADPPYKDAPSLIRDLHQYLEIIAGYGTIFIMEMDLDSASKLDFSWEKDSKWIRIKQKKYGKTSIIIWENQTPR